MQILQQLKNRYPLLYKTIVILAFIHPLLQLTLWLPIHWAREDYNRVLYLYFIAGIDVLRHHSPYTLWPGFGPDIEPDKFYYPPVFAALMAPLSKLGWIWFSRIWYGFTLIAFWLFAWSLAHIIQSRVTLKGILLIGFVIGCTPGVYAAMSIGQVDPFLWAMLASAFATENRLIRDCLLAVVTQIKLYAIWPLAYSLLKTRGRTLIPVLTIFLAGTIVGISVCGSNSYATWWIASKPVITQGTFIWTNFSVSFAVLRVARILGWHYHGGVLPNWARLYLSIMGIAGPLAAAIWGYKADIDIRKACAVIVICAVLFSPLCWWSYLPLAYIIVALRIRERSNTSSLSY